MVTMPLSGYMFETRAEDGAWRAMSPDDLGTPDHLDGLWAVWTGVQTERWGAWEPDGSWGLCWGHRPADSSAVTACLIDGTNVPVVIAGNVWICEWRDLSVDLEVHVGGKVWIQRRKTGCTFI